MPTKSSSVPLIHRDLSWLQFNERVLDQALDASNPLFERFKFLSITSSNLDEFFMIRMSSLIRKIQNPKNDLDLPAIESLIEVRESVLDAVGKMAVRQGQALDRLFHEAAELDWHWNPKASEHAERLFREDVLPYLSAPEAFGSESLKQLDNLQSAAVFDEGVWFKIPKSLPLTYQAEGPGLRLETFSLDELLVQQLGAAFRLASRPVLLRLTRDGDVKVDALEEDGSSIPDQVRSGLTARERGRPVRVQIRTDRELPDLLRRALFGSLRLMPAQVLTCHGILYFQALWSARRKLPDRVRSWIHVEEPELVSPVPELFRWKEDNLPPSSLFEKLARRDYLLHHPYDPFEAYVALIDAAAQDPAVQSIQQTVYRVDASSRVIESLKAAAKTKRVRVVIELRARFDEMNNLKLTEELRQAGVEVAFGLATKKVHAKVALIHRLEVDASTGVESVRLYTHLSTGNYHAITARHYEDLAIVTADREFGLDAERFFDSVFAHKMPQGFKVLVSAPTQLHRKIIQLIDLERDAARAGKGGRIFAKVNALVDETLIERLYLASQDGVEVDLVVRGACALIPQRRGLSERIRVTSIVDRHLEHSRIYSFQASDEMYLSSADWMPRNFFSRLELAFPVRDPRLKSFMHQIVIPTYLKDTARAKSLTADGEWIPQTGKPGVRAQQIFEGLALTRYRGTPLSRLEK